MSRRATHPFFFFAFSVALIAAMGWSLRHFSRYQPYAGLLTPDDTAQRQYALQLNDVELRGRSMGHPQWSVHANQVSLLPDQTSITIDSMNRGILMNNNHAYLRFAAKRAVYSFGAATVGTGIVSITGGIQIASIPDYMPFAAPIAFATATAVWNGYQSLLTVPETVSIAFGKTAATPVMQILADGARWNANARQLVSLKSVQIEIGSGPQTCQIQSHDLIYNEPAGQVYCSQPILITVPALGRATCRPLVVDIRKQTVDFSNVHVVADAGAILSPAPSDIQPIDKKTTTDAEKTKQDDADKDDDKVTVDAPQGGHWDEQERTLTVRGPVSFHQRDATMTTVGAVYDRKTDIAHALSPITMTDSETTVTGQSGDVNFKTHVATLSGNIKVDLEPKKDSDSKDNDTSATSEAKQPSVMTCDAIVYNYKSKTAITHGTVVIKQKHRTVTADKGTYDVKSHIAEMSGNMVATSDDGKVLKAEYAKVSVKKNDEWIDIPHPTEIVIPVNSEDNPRIDK